MSYNWGGYRSPTSCTPKIPGGAKSLLAYLEDSFPWVFSMGICNCRNTRGGSSLSHHANCRALDSGIPTNGGAYIPKYGDPIIELLGPHGRELGLDHLILNRRIYSARSPDGRYYAGTHPHRNHAHIGLTEAAAINLNYASLVAILGEPAGGENDMPFLPLKDGDGLDRGRPERREDVYLLQSLLGFAGSDLDGFYGGDTATAVAPFDPAGGDGTVCGGRTYANIQSIGRKGDDGDPGPRGLRGFKGDDGEPGEDGDPGEDGKPVTLTITADSVLP